MNRRHFVTLAGSLAVSAAARADERFPTHPLRLIIPFAAGGSTDILARICSQVLTKALGKSVVADNVTGAGGTIGAERVLGLPADGYAVLAGTPGPIIINPLLQPNISYDPLKAFKAVALVGDSPAVIVVRHDSALTTLQQLVAATKGGSDKVTYASAGIGSFAHLSGELFGWRAGVKMTHVPYRGTAPAAIDLMAGRVDVMFENYPSVQSYLESGQLRAIAVGSSKRSSLLPGVPTAAEEGVPDYESSSWFGLFVRTNAPAVAVGAVNKAINDALADPAIRSQLVKFGVEPVGGTPDAFGAYIAGKMAETRQLIEAAHIKLE